MADFIDYTRIIDYDSMINEYLYIKKDGWRLQLFYYDILEKFYNNHIKYLIVGGLSVNLYGIPRVTQDIDVIVDMDEKNIIGLIKILNELDYIPRLPVNPVEMADEKKRHMWVKEKNLKAFSFYHRKDSYKVIDILLVHPLDFASAYVHKTVKKIKDIEIYLASIDDIIIMKKYSGRKQDMSDIELLNKLKKFIKAQNE